MLELIKKNIYYFLIGGIIISSSCVSRKSEAPIADYPESIGKIIVGSCAISGCHNSSGAINAAGLDLSSWQKLFSGARTGAAIVPYSISESFLLNFINTYPDLGPVQLPVMPPNSSILSKEEVTLLQNWVANGAPDGKGNIAFEDPSISGVLVVNQGCDRLSLIHPQLGIVMRSFEIGLSPQVESPHQIRFRPDRKYAYIVYLFSAFVDILDPQTRKIIGRIETTDGNWNTIVFSPDNKYAFVADFQSEGKIACLDLETNQMIQLYQGSGYLQFPHGQALSADGKILFVASQSGNFIQRLDITDPLQPIKLSPYLLDGSAQPTTTPAQDPHELALTPDGQYLLVTCQRTNDLRIISATTGALIKIIPVGTFPQEMVIPNVTGRNEVLITCPEDTLSFPGIQQRGSVYVVNYLTQQVTGSFYPGFQPHGIDIDNNTGEVWVACRNIAPNGNAPHHTTVCGDRIGYLNRFNWNTYQKINPYPIWVSVDPYGIAIP